MEKRLFKNNAIGLEGEFYFVPESDIEAFADGLDTYVMMDGRLYENEYDVLAIDGGYMFEPNPVGFATGYEDIFDEDKKPLDYADLDPRYEGHVYHDGQNHQFIKFSDAYGEPTDFEEVEIDDSFPDPGDGTQCVDGLDPRDGLYITIWQAPDGTKWHRTASVWQASLPWACWTREK